MNNILGKKIGMTKFFRGETGESIPVTVLQLGPNIVYQVKTGKKDGYSALQVGFGSQKPQRVNKALKGHFSRAEKGFPEKVMEIDIPEGFAEGQKAIVAGDVITLEGMFEIGSRVDVFGTTSGKGYQGVIKRHGMSGQPATHGTHEFFRHGGSIGNRKFPGRVFKNKRMAGRMGGNRVVQQGLEVVDIRPEDNLMVVRGSVPGRKNSYVLVKTAIKGL